MTRYLRKHILLQLLVLLMFLTAAQKLAPQVAGPKRGIIDFRKEVEKQIHEIEARLQSDLDMSAEKQYVLRLWLIELYDSTSNFDEVKRNYEKILSLFPHDVGTLNRYAQFYLEREKNFDAAWELLQEARQYGELTGAKDLDRGSTQLLLGRVHLVKNELAKAISALKRAVFLLEEHPKHQQDALRSLASASSRDGNYEEALKAYLDLIGKQRRFSPSDLAELERFLKLIPEKEQSNPEMLSRGAIRREKYLQAEKIELEGGSVVIVTSEDGFPLEGTFLHGASKGAVLFFPTQEQTRSAFRIHAQLLFSSGISSLALDRRGEGGSRSESFDDSRELARDRLPDDVHAGVSFLMKKLSLAMEQIVIVSEGQGCSNVEMAIARYRISSPVLYLSPLFDSDDRDLFNALAFRPDNPVYAIYSDEDRGSLFSFAYFRSVKAHSKLESLTLKKAGHGADMLRRSPRALAAFEKWIGQMLGSPR